MLSENQIHRIGRIDQIVRDYFLANPALKEIPAKDLMPLFIEKDVFKSNHRNDLPIREVLRELDSNNKLHLLKHVKVARKVKNRGWFFYNPSLRF